jgi:hypothetical protein
LWSDQKVASASSLSKIGTSSHFAIVRMSLSAAGNHHRRTAGGRLPGQSLFHLPLVEKPLFGFKGPGVEDADLFAVGPIHAEDPDASGGHSKVEKPGLD